MGGNQYKEKWTLEAAKEFLEEAVELSNSKDYDFIGEVAKDMDSYIEIFDYLVEKFPELKPLKTRIKRNCEVNCFSNAKKGDIVPSIAIMNLKSNHNWTDRQQTDVTTNGKEINQTSTIVFKKFNDEE